MRQFRFLCVAGLLVSGMAGAQDISGYGLLLGAGWSGLHGSDATDMDAYFDEGRYWPEERDGFMSAGNNTKGTLGGTLNWMAGGYLKVEWNDYIFNRAEVYYTWLGADYQKELTLEETYGNARRVDSLRTILENDGEELVPGERRYELTNGYVQLPVMLGVNLNRDFNIYAGPSFNYFINSNFSIYFNESTLPAGDYDGKKNYTSVEVPMTSFTMAVIVAAEWVATEQFGLGIRYQYGITDIVHNEKAPNIQNNAVSMTFDFNFNQW